MKDKKNTAMWKPFNDGWFSYYFCTNCGKKVYDNTDDTCPQCKSAMTNYKEEK